MNKWILIIVLVINIIGICGCLWCNISTTNHLKKALFEQREDIQEVMSKLPPSVAVDCHLAVEDKSKMTINGKGNSGSISVPQDKTYYLELKMDSVSIKVNNK